MRRLALVTAFVFGLFYLISLYCSIHDPTTARINSVLAQEQTIEKEFKVAAGKKIRLDLKTGGSINIGGWDEDRLSAKVYLDGADWRESKVEFEERPDGIQIKSFYAGRRSNHSTDIKFDINVPRRFDIEIGTMGGGIRITGVNGEMNGKTMGGELYLTNLQGKLNLTTMGGNITLKDSEVDGGLHTMGGQVLIQDVVGNIKGSSMGGNVIYKNLTNREGASTGSEVRISTMGGDIKVDDAPMGADVHTMGGRIKILSAREYVKAKTMGGNIDIDEIDGWVQATTMGGDINVRMIGDPDSRKRDVTLKSYGGNISLTLPDDLSMEFDIQLSYTNNSKMNYRIISDFELRQQESDKWDKGHGTPRKYIYGTGIIAGGKNKIKIETINGNIYLRKAQ